jgi:hypothetical protein
MDDKTARCSPAACVLWGKRFAFCREQNEESKSNASRPRFAREDRIWIIDDDGSLFLTASKLQKKRYPCGALCG